MSMGKGFKSFLAAAFITLLATTTGQAAEVTLRAVTALPRQHPQAASFLKHFVEPLNKAGHGIIRINYLGGPEVTPANRAPAALKRGVIDMYWTPAGYLAGRVPEARAMILRKVKVSVLRKNGGFEMFNKAFETKLNSHLLAWGEPAGGYYFYTTRKPNLKGGIIDFSGFKMRATPTYRPLERALNSTTVEMPLTEVFTALQRGIVDGFGWATVGLSEMGLTKTAKYRVEPSFYSLGDPVLVNEDKWKSLPEAAKKILNHVAVEYEKTSIAEIQKLNAVDIAAEDKVGIKAVRQEGASASKYRSIADDVMWKVISKRIGAKEAAALKGKLSKP